MSIDLDPRWNWIEVEQFGYQSTWIRGRCNHLDTEPVISIDGEHVAQLCLTCDAQLPPKAAAQ